MTGPRHSTRAVLPGEAIMLRSGTSFDPVAWSVYLRTSVDSASILLARWLADADAVSINASAPADLMPAIDAIAGTVDGPEFSSDALALIETAGANRRSCQALWYSSEGVAVYVTTLDFGDERRTDLDALIASDEDWLAALEKARMDATATQGVVQLQLPDGTMQTYRGLAQLDGVITTVADRLARDKAARGGRYLIGSYIP